MTKKFATCFDCYHWPVCYMSEAISKLITGNRFLNIDDTEAPGNCMKLYETLALCCLKFKARGWVEEKTR